MRKIIISILLGITFILVMSLAIVGFSSDKAKKVVENDISKFDLKPNDIVFTEKNGGGPNIKVYITKTNKIEEMSLEEYVRGVVCAEMPAEFGLEALKAQAVAARTFALVHMEGYGGTKYDGAKGADVTDTVECQVYINKEDRLKEWPEKYAGAYWNKITKAVEDTKGQVITYNGEIIKYPYYFSTSPGKTENSKDVIAVDMPYLRSVSSEGDKESPKFKNIYKMSNKDFITKVNSTYKGALNANVALNKQIVIKSKTGVGTVKEIKLGNVTIKGTDFRWLVGITSSYFSFSYDKDNITIDCRGYGHDLGMSQWGARDMAKQGKNYIDILIHYYQGVKIQKIEWKAKDE